MLFQKSVLIILHDKLLRPQNGMTQFDVSLASLAPGDYHIALVATSHAGEAKTGLNIRVTG